MNPWRWWTDRVDRDMDIRPIALMRILVPLCVLLDLLRVAQIGMVEHYFRTYKNGGLNKSSDGAYILDQWMSEPTAGMTAYFGTLICMLLSMLGVATRPALVAGVLLYAQLGHLYPPGDRGIDRMLRTVLLILVFSGAHKRWSLQNWLTKGKAAETVKAWPYMLTRWLLVMIYMSAGISKLMQQPSWLSYDARFPPLYRIMGDPLSSDVSAVFLAQIMPLMILGSWFTIVYEVGGFMILTRFRKYWAVPGVFLHLGIAMTMVLGMFSYGMLSMYCVMIPEWLCRLFDKFPALRNKSGVTGAYGPLAVGEAERAQAAVAARAVGGG